MEIETVNGQQSKNLRLWNVKLHEAGKDLLALVRLIFGNNWERRCYTHTICKHGHEHMTWYSYEDMHMACVYQLVACVHALQSKSWYLASFLTNSSSPCKVVINYLIHKNLFCIEIFSYLFCLSCVIRISKVYSFSHMQEFLCMHLLVLLFHFIILHNIPHFLFRFFLFFGFLGIHV